MRFVLLAGRVVAMLFWLGHASPAIAQTDEIHVYDAAIAPTGCPNQLSASQVKLEYARGGRDFNARHPRCVSGWTIKASPPLLRGTTAKGIDQPADTSL